jgi:DNA helicase HerA-like ATPase
MDRTDLSGKQVAVFGKKGMGKSGFVNHLMSKMEGHYACFDPMHEHEDYKQDDLVVRPTSRRGDEAIKQLSEFVEFAVENRYKFDYIVVDEINRFHSKRSELAGPIGDLVDFTAHYNIGFIFCARRPVQVHADLQELSDYQFIFRLSGANDCRRLDDISSGLGERAASLDKYEHITVRPGGRYSIQRPIDPPSAHEKGV